MVEKIFEKDIYQITLDDLITFFKSEQEESALIEFKSGDSSWEDIYKEVTAFVNTEGGILIIGAPRETKVEENKKLIRSFCQGELTASTIIKTKDSLYQKIASNIIPTPINIKIQEIQYKTGKCFILDIPKSLDPPHQCGSDGKYYIRLEREAKFAPHGIVQALFNQRKKAELKCEIVCYENYDRNDIFRIRLTISNASRLPAEDVHYRIQVVGPIRLLESSKNFKEFGAEYGKNYDFQYKAPFSLVAPISLTDRFDLECFGDVFYVFVVYWCKDTEAEYCVLKVVEGQEPIVQCLKDDDNSLILEYGRYISEIKDTEE